MFLTPKGPWIHLYSETQKYNEYFINQLVRSEDAYEKMAILHHSGEKLDRVDIAQLLSDFDCVCKIIEQQREFFEQFDLEDLQDTREQLKKAVVLLGGTVEAIEIE